MKSFGRYSISGASHLILGLAALSALSFAQNSPGPASPGGWRRVGDTPQNQAAAPDQGVPAETNDPQNQVPPPSNEGPYVLPPRLTIQPGTYLTVRLNQALSSDVNQPGDGFTATLVRPIIVDGVVVAQRGQTLGGRVAETRKAGRVEGVSRLGIQLTDLPLVDGQQLPVQTQLVQHAGGTSMGRDAAAIGGTTALGAAIGGAVEGGMGAGIGAAAGAMASTIGVLLTRGRPTVIYPESVLTFRVLAPVSFSTERAPQAFRFVRPGDYEQPAEMQARQAAPPPACYGCAPPPPPYYYGYGPGYYPYYWGPSFAFMWGPRYWGPGFYYGHGFYRGWHR